VTDQGNRTTTLLFGALAAAAGLALAAYLWRLRSGDDIGSQNRERGVADVLEDCYSRLREVQSGLARLQETP
jgi:hypothetical protein